MICFNRALEITGTDQVLVPGCEPTSAMSSDTLARFNECGCALVPLNAVLDAIPGSTVRFGTNFGDGVRQRWLVLPAECPVCPCEGTPDYYAIIRELCEEEPEEPDLEECEVNWKVDVCVPDMRDQDAPPNPYFPEGTNPVVDNLWGSSPWYLQQVNKALAAGEDPPALPSAQPIQSNNQEPTVITASGVIPPPAGMEDLLNIVQ